MEVMMLNCYISVLLLVTHMCTERPQQMIMFPVPFQGKQFYSPTATPHILNFLGDALSPTFLSMLLALAEEFYLRKREQFSSNFASS